MWLVLCCPCKGGRKKKQGTLPTSTWNVTAHPRQKAYHDIERGEKAKSNGAKDGRMVVLGAGATIAATAVTAAGGDVVGIVARVVDMLTAAARAVQKILWN